MANHRTVDLTIWGDKDFKRSTLDAKVIFVFLFSNPSTTESGIYEITPEAVRDGTGVKLSRVLDILKTRPGVFRNVYYDFKRCVVFVVNFRKRQKTGGNPDLLAKAIARERATITTPLWRLYDCLYGTDGKRLPNGSINRSIELEIEIELAVEVGEGGSGGKGTGAPTAALFPAVVAAAARDEPEPAPAPPAVTEAMVDDVVAFYRATPKIPSLDRLDLAKIRAAVRFRLESLVEHPVEKAEERGLTPVGACQLVAFFYSRVAENKNTFYGGKNGPPVRWNIIKIMKGHLRDRETPIFEMMLDDAIVYANLGHRNERWIFDAARILAEWEKATGGDGP